MNTGTGAAPPPIDLPLPDIEPFRHGNSGVEWVHVLDSGRPGPTVLVQALTHGNEICGALALATLFAQEPVVRQGRLILVFANTEAFSRFDREDPHASRYVDEDLNRVWSDEVLFGSRDSCELRRARKLQPFVDAADIVLDLHSMHDPCRPIMVCGRAEKNAAFARRLGVPDTILLDTGHPAGLRMIERGGLGDPDDPRLAVLIECGQHWERSAEAVAVDTVMRVLAASAVVDPAWALERAEVALPQRQRTVVVTEAVVVRSADFRFLVPPVGLGIVGQAGTPIAQDGDHVWRAPYDDTVLVMPSLSHLRPGNTQVRLGRFVD